MTRLITAIVAAFWLSAATVHAQPPLSGSDAWIPEAPPVASVMAGYVVFRNSSDEAVIIVRAHSEDFDKVEFHRSIEKDGMATMVKHDELRIDPKQDFVLQPGGYHLMLIGPKRPLRAGETTEVVFQTRAGVNLPVSFTVNKPQGKPHQHHHH